MKEYLYSYQSITRFSSCVSSHSWLLRPSPCENTRQTILKSDVTVFPRCTISEGKDYFGSSLLYGRIEGTHNKFGYISTGIVRIDDSMEEDDDPLMIYKMPSSLTTISEHMRANLKGLNLSGNDFEKATSICEMVHHEMTYSPGVTNVMTPASEAFEKRQGVCQDFSHIMISLCREAGLYARYVCGLVCGEGETHAWVEVWHKGFWYPFDPTAGKMDADKYGYIKIVHGRDALDGPVNRGVFTGITSEETEIKVVVERYG